MLKFLRLGILLLCPLLFGAAWYLLPALLASEAVRWLSAVFTAVWGLELLFFRRLSEVSAVSGLSTREHERLAMRLAAIRKRVWWIGAIGLACSALNWLLAMLELPASSPLYAAAVGMLFGISVSYLVLVPAWFNESQAFIDKVRLQAETEKRRQEVLKGLKG